MIGFLARWFYVFVVPFETLILYMHIILMADSVLITLFFCENTFFYLHIPYIFFYLVVAIGNIGMKSCALKMGKLILNVFGYRTLLHATTL
jgi:hypothetical protein